LEWGHRYHSGKITASFGIDNPQGVNGYRVGDSPVRPETWFTLEIIAIGNRIRILVNGKKTADYTESRAGRNTKGHIALQHLDPETRVFFRKIELKELPSAKSAAGGAFVMLGSKGVVERNFNTLAEAVVGASDGDTIEVRGNGPFVIEPIEISHALTIRAGAGFRPVITDKTQIPMPDRGLLVAHGPLRLEGLELRRSSRASCILTAGGPLCVANCRLLIQPQWGTCIHCFVGCLLRNCELSSPEGAALSVGCDSDASIVVENCLLVGFINLDDGRVTQGATVRFTRNTFHTGVSLTVFHHIAYMPRDQVPKPPSSRIRVFASENVLDSLMYGYILHQPEPFKPKLTAVEAEAWVPRRLEWREERNVYQPGKSWTGTSFPNTDRTESPVLTRGEDLADWNRFWGLKDTESSQGVIRYHGGNLRAKATADAEKLSPEDFRLRPDSAGYRAGKDGKDLGADVDLVGPGPAYERWKKTPEYQQWLKDIGQVKK